MGFVPFPQPETPAELMTAVCAAYGLQYPKDELTITQKCVSVTPTGAQIFVYPATAKLYPASTDPAGNSIQISPADTRDPRVISQMVNVTLFTESWVAAKVALGYPEAQVRGWLTGGAMVGDFQLPAPVPGTTAPTS
jgi:hypothetical protein